MLKWLASLMASSLTFALADILCDVCITEQPATPVVETAADDDEAEEVDDDPGRADGSGTAGAGGDDGSDSDEREMHVLSVLTPQSAPLYKQLSSSSAHRKALPSGASSSSRALDEQGGLSGEQDTAIAGFVTIFGLLVTVVYMAAAGGSAIKHAHFQWSPFTHLQFWFAMLGGSMAFLHYYFLLKAFEGAPSTVLLPLVQVASVSVLIGSSVVALLRNEPWITPTHAVAYLLMFVGGILPACDGQLSALLHRSFWSQAFVSFAIFAEFALGLHDLMLSGCAYRAERVQTNLDLEVVESFEFFVWSRCSFVGTFFLMYALSPKLNMQLRDLFAGRIRIKFITLSAFSEGLTVIGFYLASIAYGLFYQAGIVHAAEASLSQLLNLLLAFLLLKCFGIGRASAVGSMSAKLISFVMVTVGLFLCTLEDSPPAKSTMVANPT